ncbi:hypothetical protein DITRI_Ditri18aG0091100 [Diplodiscus trichospermus]
MVTYCPNFQIKSPRNGRDENSPMSHLIDDNTKLWKLDLVDEFFNEEEAFVIKFIPISKSSLQDAKTIWTRRNNEFHAEARKSSLISARFVLQFIEDFNKAQTKIRPSILNSTARWRPPRCGAFKVNFDAAFDSFTKTNGVGVVIRDSKGAVMGAMASSKKWIYELFMIEPYAILYALDFASNMGF